MADELIKLDTTIIGIEKLIIKASTAAEARALYNAKDVIISQQRYFADVQPVKCGHWIENIGYSGWGDTIYFCSECGSEWTHETGISINWNFCPNCGAKMSTE